MRTILSAVTAVSLFATSAFAQDSQPAANPAPLPPGNAAGIHNAQIVGDPNYLWAGIGVIALATGIAIAVTNDHHHHSSTTSTTTTEP